MTTDYVPIRISPVLFLDGVDAGVKAKVEEVVPRMAEKFAEMLQVIPGSQPFYAHRICTTLIQLSGGGVGCSQYVSETEAVCDAGDGTNVAIPPEYLAQDIKWTSTTTSVTVGPSGNPGINNTDFLLLVTAEETSFCTGSVAYGLSCERGDLDRPTVGRINFCPSDLANALDGFAEAVTTHEILHALGFSSSALPYFRNTDGTPKTTRNSLGQPDDLQDDVCSRKFFMPSTSTTLAVISSERGNTCPSRYTSPSDCVFKVVTPHVVSAARTYFDCPTLDGMEWENQPTDTCAVVGSHWEQRLANSELMASTLTRANGALLSPMTLALLQDSGWYQVNYTASSPLRQGIDWGFRQGCDFALEKCIDSTTGTARGTPPHFVDTPDFTLSKCVLDRTSVGNVGYVTGVSQSQYQYFTGASQTRGGAPIQADYCPLVRTFTNTLCSHAPFAPSPDTNYQGQVFGPGSLCVEATITTDQRSFPDKSSVVAGCYSVTCVSRSELTISVAQFDSTSGVPQDTITCLSGDTSSKTVSGYDGTVACLDPDVWCVDAFQYDPQDATRPGFLAMSPSTYSVATTDTSVTLYVSRTLGEMGAATVDYTTVAGTAVAGSDFTAATGTLTWDASVQGEQSITVTLLPAPSRSVATQFTVELSSPTGASLTSGATTATITIGAASPSPSPSPSSAVHGRPTLFATLFSMVLMTVLAMAVRL